MKLSITYLVSCSEDGLCKIPVDTRGITGTGCGYGAVSKFGHRTRTRATRFGNTAGLPAPMANPTLIVTES